MNNSNQSKTNHSANEGATINLPNLLTQKDLAEYLCKSEAWCERSRWEGSGPKFIKLGRHVRYKENDVLAWIESCSECTSTSMESQP
jgi:predicted DNA-binding transcriptional regulator AlpA